ncbi:hypothetical protein MKW98_023945 [Papaver atlanticum]|uniref:Uncharacterized protein n=1 Tax=Papaver atlanticum TaxID=357466 RepID=A0AAD4SZR5_9MAGN|nr:hypothetical protein MKW98_023945 [Papaver atlanticum]
MKRKADKPALQDFVPPEHESPMQKDSRELNERRALHAEATTKVFARNAKEAEMNREMSRHLEVAPTNTGTKVMKSNVETKTLSQIEDEVPLAIRKKALVRAKDNN